MSKKLVTFCTRNGEYEYFDYGIYNEGMSEEELCKNFFGLSKINNDSQSIEGYEIYRLGSFC